MPSGKLKSSEKSTSFVCVEAQTSPIPNDMVMEGKVSGGGSKILKGRMLFNGFGTDASIFTCVQN